jgi:hypothetical protein
VARVKRSAEGTRAVEQPQSQDDTASAGEGDGEISRLHHGPGGGGLSCAFQPSFHADLPCGWDLAKTRFVGY